MGSNEDVPKAWVRVQHATTRACERRYRACCPCASQAPQDMNTTSSRQSPVANSWALRIVISAPTSIAQVTLPFWDRNNPVSGAKEARDSMRKLLRGMNNDVDPLHFRGKYDKDTDKIDPYFPYAPGWTTLSGGKAPYVSCTPANIVKWVMDAVQCVPLINNEVEITINEADNTKTRVTCEQLIARDIKIQTVPRLFVKPDNTVLSAGSTSPSKSSDGAGPSSDNGSTTDEAEALRVQVATQADHVKALEASLNDLKEKLAAAQTPPRNPKAKTPPPAPDIDAPRAKRARK